MIFFIGVGQLAHQRRDRQDLVAARELRVLEQVDDLDPVLALEVLLADPLQVREGRHAPGGLAGDVEAQLPRRAAARRSSSRRDLAGRFFMSAISCAARWRGLPASRREDSAGARPWLPS